jgi:site-specific DNA-methyltransferase (adenine-specific)
VQETIENERGTKSAANACYTGLPMNTLYNMDCMDGMALFPDKFFDLAIVDPPYGIGAHKQLGKKKGEKGNKWNGGNWDNEKPNKFYFNELFRVSKNQVIWGGNYFDLPPTRCFFIYDKVQRIDLADCEFAWTSFDSSARIFTYARGNLQGFRNPGRFHPTEKPRALYRWILSNYAEDCETILDTHAGSCSSCIEFEINGFQWIAFEKDVDYYNDAKERMKRELAQTRLDLQV